MGRIDSWRWILLRMSRTGLARGDLSQTVYVNGTTIFMLSTMVVKTGESDAKGTHGACAVRWSVRNPLHRVGSVGFPWTLIPLTTKSTHAIVSLQLPLRLRPEGARLRWATIGAFAL